MTWSPWHNSGYYSCWQFVVLRALSEELNKSVEQDIPGQGKEQNIFVLKYLALIMYVIYMEYKSRH